MNIRIVNLLSRAARIVSIFAVTIFWMYGVAWSVPPILTAWAMSGNYFVNLILPIFFVAGLLCTYTFVMFEFLFPDRQVISQTGGTA